MVNNPFPDIEVDENDDQYNFGDLEQKIRKANSLYDKEEEETPTPKQTPFKDGLNTGFKHAKYIAKSAFTTALGGRYQPQQSSKVNSAVDQSNQDSFSQKNFKQLLEPLNSIKNSALVLVNLLTKMSTNNKTSSVSPSIPIAQKIIASNDNVSVMKKPLYETPVNDNQSNPIKQYAQDVQSIVKEQTKPNSESVPKERKETLSTGQEVIRDTRTGRFVKNQTEPPQLKPASTGESSTSSYSQNERQEEKITKAEIEKFSDEAVKQLSDIFSEAMKDMPDSSATAGGGLLGSIGGMFGLGGISKATKGVGKMFSGLGKGASKTTGKVLSKTAGAIEETAASSKGFLKGADKLAKGAGKILPKLSKGLGIAAIPVVAGLEAKDRIDQGQTKNQVIAGTTGSTVGGLAGAWAGGQAGAAVGAGIGSLFGGVGAAPGAIIGGGIGAIGGAFGGSKIGGSLADHFTGAGKIQPKEVGPTHKTKDLTSLQKRQAEIQKKQQNQSPLSSYIDTRSQTTVVNQKNTSMVAAGPSHGGNRGSLDLKKFGQH